MTEDFFIAFIFKVLFQLDAQIEKVGKNYTFFFTSA